MKKNLFPINGEIPDSMVKKYCPLGREQADFLEEFYQQGQVSMRQIFKIIRVGKTIADLRGSDEIQGEDLAEAVCMRSTTNNTGEGLNERRILLLLAGKNPWDRIENNRGMDKRRIYTGTVLQRGFRFFKKHPGNDRKNERTDTGSGVEGTDKKRMGIMPKGRNPLLFLFF